MDENIDLTPKNDVIFKAQQIKGDYKWNCVYDELKQRYDDIVADPEVRELIRVREKAERDYNSAILQARMEEQEKAYQEKIESAKSLLRANIPVEVISDSLGLPVEEIQELK